MHTRQVLATASCSICIILVYFLHKSYFKEKLRPNIEKLIIVMSHVYPNLDNLPRDQYGCWCNSVHKGKVIDKIDGCCKIHSQCYGHLSRKYGCTNEASEYSLSISSGHLKCDIDEPPCSKLCCECDIALIKCMTDNMSVYDGHHYLKHVNHLCVDKT